MKFELWVLLLAVNNIWLGAICWIAAGVPGLILGSIFMEFATIAGVLLRGCRDKGEQHGNN